MAKSDLRLGGNDDILELYKDSSPDPIPSFEGILSELMEEWSGLWKRVGGLGGQSR